MLNLFQHPERPQHALQLWTLKYIQGDEIDKRVLRLTRFLAFVLQLYHTNVKFP